MTPLVYLDSNVFITAFEGPPDLQAGARRLFLLAEQGVYIAVTSELTLAECLVGPMRANQPDLIRLYRSLLRGRAEFKVKPVNRAILEQAAACRSREAAIKLPDAVHLATALVAECHLFVSDDRRLRFEGTKLAFAPSATGIEAISLLAVGRP